MPETPTLVSAIDRAVRLCAQTLDFTRQGAPRIEPTRFDLRTLVAEVRAALPGVLPGTLPDNVNGNPVTAEDVAFSLDVVKKHHRFGSQMFGPIESYDYSDPHKLVVTLSQPHGPLLLAADRVPGLPFDGALVSPPAAALWG